MPWPLQITVIVLAVVVAMIGTVLLVRTHPKMASLHEGTGGMEGPSLTVVAGSYAIIIAFMVLVTWTRFDTAQSMIEREANTLANLYRLAEGLPEPTRSEVRQSCRDYLTIVTMDEWPAMRQRSSSPRAWAQVDLMWALFNRIAAHDDQNTVIHAQLLSTFIELTYLRRSRLLLARLGLHPLLWTILIIGGIITLVHAALFGKGHLISHLLQTTTLAAIITIVIYLIWAFGNPFQGAVAVTTQAFEPTRDIIMQGR